jgi:hypothetical protein
MVIGGIFQNNNHYQEITITTKGGYLIFLVPTQWVSPGPLWVSSSPRSGRASPCWEARTGAHAVGEPLPVGEAYILTNKTHFGEKFIVQLLLNSTLFWRTKKDFKFGWSIKTRSRQTPGPDFFLGSFAIAPSELWLCKWYKICFLLPRCSSGQSVTYSMNPALCSSIPYFSKAAYAAYALDQIWC